MKTMYKTAIIVASALICASCSNYYSKHGQDSRYGTTKRHHPAQYKGAARHAQEADAQTRGVQFAEQADEHDMAYQEDTNPGQNSKSTTAASTTSTQYKHFASQYQSPKCIPSNPRGGVEQHVFFNFDRSSVTSADLTAVKNQAKYLLAHPNAKARIEGNADDRGSREYNIALGARRAKAVIALLKQEGVPANQCTIVSYGAEKPAAKGETEAAYHCNRRVDIVYEDDSHA